MISVLMFLCSCVIHSFLSFECGDKLQVSFGAFAGYVAGIAVYLAQHELLGTLGVTTEAVATLGS